MSTVNSFQIKMEKNTHKCDRKAVNADDLINFLNTTTHNTVLIGLLSNSDFQFIIDIIKNFNDQTIN